MKKLFKNSGESHYVVSNVDKRVISNAYKSVERDIESLRKYDRGDKKIDASNLRAALRNVR